ncbi:outer membrane protein assembly factor BamA [Candidatus Pelagibacter sp.]|uniref:outer membrane protein assembly factor BamA n=1 Tax=Candidatus Pelagibacter sp. TaxID=2024849 RepID=UPI003F836A62
MFTSCSKLFLTFFVLFLLSSNAYSVTLTNINVEGNDRISNETIKMFSDAKIGDDLNEVELNEILKKLYETNYFEDVSIEFIEGKLNITVKENPIIENVNYIGIKSNTLKESITKNLNLKSRSSYNDILLEKDRNLILSSLKEQGYYFSEVVIEIVDLKDNKIDLNYNIELNNKAKIKKISFIGNKIYKDRKLRNIIISEEYKFWKIISGKKYLNENLINFDKRLLRNFYLNKGYYDVKINSSFAKLIDNNGFELIFNIDAKNKFYFGNLSLIIPTDFDDANFENLNKIFEDLKNEPYSINSVENIINEIDKVAISEQYEAIQALVKENIEDNTINLEFLVEETEKFLVEKINIFGNNITRESVIRNQFYIDEGDNFNDILANKTINEIKSLNFFKTVELDIVEGKNQNSKILNINVEEKPTGEIMAGAGFGTDGSVVEFGVKENNYLGKGLAVVSNLSVGSDNISGNLSIKNPNFKNTDKAVNFGLQANENDRLVDSGYKSKKIGSSLGTNFEYLEDLNFGIKASSFIEKIETDTNASARQKKMEGDYFDTYLKLSFDYDKRNQKFNTNDGFRSFYSVDLPLISDNNTLTNMYNYKVFSELYEDNISSISLTLSSANSITDDDVKLSERLYIPGKKLRGFVRGRVGPKDGADFIGGNYYAIMNLSSTLPQILPNSQNIDFATFIDVANLWGVDDKSLDDSSKIRSSVGLGVDWFTAVGPLSFSFAQPITKDSTDETETFRFNLGTTF